MRSKTPFCVHRRNRFHTLYHFPKSDGKSLHGVPLRAIHNTASRKSRLSCPERPGSPVLPGNSGATRSHCSSVSSRRFKAGLLRFPALNQIWPFMGIPSGQECPQALARIVAPVDGCAPSGRDGKGAGGTVRPGTPARRGAPRGLLQSPRSSDAPTPGATVAARPSQHHPMRSRHEDRGTPRSVAPDPHPPPCRGRRRAQGPDRRRGRDGAAEALTRLTRDLYRRYRP